MISILDPSEGSHGGPTLVERMHLAFSNDGKLAGSPQFA
jgi:hypothetical protein